MVLSDHVRPTRSRGVRAYRLGDETLLYAPASQTAHAVNAPAMAIWELSDGSRSVWQIAEELGRWVDRPAAELLADVKHGISQLTALGLLHAS